MHETQWSPERPLPPPVSLASQSHREKPPEVTCTSRGNPGFPASTRERPRETFFNTSRGQIPLPWLGSSDALPLATRVETRLPWRPTRGSLTSPSYLVETCRRLHDRDLIGAAEGNVSVRIGGGRFLVTPSGANKARLSPADLVVVGADGRPMGAGRASTELRMHLAVYAARPDAGAV